MQPSAYRFSRLLLMTSSVLVCTAAFLHAGAAFAQFDPNAGTNIPAGNAAPATLPSTRVLREETPVRPLYSAGTYVSPLAPVQMPKPLYPAKAGAVVSAPVAVAPAPTPAPMVVSAPAPAAVPVVAPAAPVLAATPSMPDLPPVDPAVAAKAQAMMGQSPKLPSPAPVTMAAPAAPASAGFVAPAPLITTSAAPAQAAVVVPAQPSIVVPVAKAPAVAVVPKAAPQQPMIVPAPASTTVATAPSENLSSQTRAILGTVPSKIDSPKVEKQTRVNLNHVSPQIQDVLGSKVQEEKFESVGLSIKVRRPGLDTNYELNNAYNALMGGDAQTAIDIYKNILSVDPTNQDALFGLAATYHRTGQAEKARPYYGMLLKLNPNHREALNNFLVLVSDESPQDALPELERLELRNPDFSPIPAQIAVVYDKLGYPDKAEDKMLRAIELSPENLTYKYNLATMMDHHHRYADAVALYRLLIDASLRGEDVPAPLESLQRRLNYITTAANEGRLGS